MQTWEYKILKDVYLDPLIEDKFNQMGDEGWELAAVAFTDSGLIRHAVFKRPKS